MNSFDQAKTAFVSSLSSQPMFADTLSFIEEWYQFVPGAFRNGALHNEVSQNQGSCKVFALSQLLNLSKEQTLQCFGEHYRDVLNTPDADNHHNIRRVIAEDITDIEFDQFPLTRKHTASA